MLVGGGEPAGNLEVFEGVEDVVGAGGVQVGGGVLAIAEGLPFFVAPIVGEPERRGAGLGAGDFADVDDAEGPEAGVAPVVGADGDLFQEGVVDAHDGGAALALGEEVAAFVEAEGYGECLVVFRKEGKGEDGSVEAPWGEVFGGGIGLEGEGAGLGGGHQEIHDALLVGGLFLSGDGCRGLSPVLAGDDDGGAGGRFDGESADGGDVEVCQRGVAEVVDGEREIRDGDEIRLRLHWKGENRLRPVADGGEGFGGFRAGGGEDVEDGFLFLTEVGDGDAAVGGGCAINGQGEL